MVLVPHGRHIGLSLKDDLPTTPHSVASSHQAMQAYDNRADIEPQLAVDGCLFNAIALMEAPQGFRPSSTLTAGSGKPAAVTSPGGGVSGRTYHCQRCLNHGKEVARKGHKRFCEWATCSCVQCVLVEKRKMLNRQINSECERSQPIPSSSSSSSNGSDREGHAGGHSSKRKSRNPKCARCGVHNRQAEPPPLKGHKKVCPYQHCNCYKCQLVTQRRSVMARQIHLRRSQKARQSNGSTATMAIEGDIANKMLPLGQADVVGPLPMNVAPAVNNSYSMDMMMPTSPLMGHPTLPSMAEHSHPALVIPSRPTPTYSSQLYNALAPAGRWPSNAGETGYIDVAGRAGLLVPSLLTNWETTAAAAGGWLTATGSPSLVFQQAPTSVQQALFDLRLPRWVSSGCWSAVDLASPPLITAGRTFIPSVADLHRLSVHLNQLFAVKNFPSGIADVSSAIIPSSGVRGELPA